MIASRIKSKIITRIKEANYFQWCLIVLLPDTSHQEQMTLPIRWWGITRRHEKRGDRSRWHSLMLAPSGFILISYCLLLLYWMFKLGTCAILCDDWWWLISEFRALLTEYLSKCLPLLSFHVCSTKCRCSRFDVVLSFRIIEITLSYFILRFDSLF